MAAPNPARLLFPALRWDAKRGFDQERSRIDEALELGVGGFVLFGGPAPMVEALVTELRGRATWPLLIGSDLERGAGQQFAGATQLPPLAALGALDEVQTTRRAAQLTAREAMALGVNWIYAPDADVDLEVDNPIVGTRSFGTDVELVSRHVRAWIEGCHLSGALACAKHFPGHGRTLRDSHEELPVVDAPLSDLAVDLAPFRAAVEAGVDTIMTAHVAYPELDASGLPATLSARIITDLLKRGLGFEGVVATDALNMKGVHDGQDEAGAAIRAVTAGCDALLYPDDPVYVAHALTAALGDSLDPERVADAIQRQEALLRRTTPLGGMWGRDEDHDWALDVAVRTLVVPRGVIALPQKFELVTIDDDLGGPFAPPSRAPLLHALRENELDVVEAATPGDAAAIIAIYADIRAWKGRPGLSASARQRLDTCLAAQPDALVILFGHPRLAEDMPGERVLAAWGGEAIMQRAVARRLAHAVV